MTYVITDRCVDCRFTYCVAECPANCFYEVKDPAMLVIHPDECVDCDACVPLCPINAIWPGDDLPPEFSEWTQKNAELAPMGTQVSSGSDPSVTFSPPSQSSAFFSSHSAYSGGSSWSGQIAAIGQAGTQASQSMHTFGSITSIAGSFVSQKQLTGHSTTQ